MKNKIWSVFLLKGNLLFANTSLFFTDEEISRIREYRVENENLETPSEPFVSAMIYIDKNHWSLYVNNRILRSGESNKVDNFYLEKLSLKEIEFSQDTAKISGPMHFTLDPYRAVLLGGKF